MKRLTTLMIFLFSLQGITQEKEFSPELENLFNDYTAFYSSLEYKEYRRASDEFGKKIPNAPSPLVDFEEWIKAHIKETNCKTIEEALKLKLDMDKARKVQSKKSHPIQKRRLELREQSGNEDEFDEMFSNELDKRIFS